MLSTSFINTLRYAAVGGNILFILWVLFNAMDEGFQGTLPEKFSMVGLILLLTLNSLFLLNKNLRGT